MNKTYVIAAIIIVFGIAIDWQDWSIYGRVFSTILLLVGAFVIGRESKK